MGIFAYFVPKNTIDTYGFDNGDVVAFSGYHPISLLIEVFTASKICHVGLVVKENNQLFIIEAQQKGIVKLPLADKLKNTKDTLFHLKLNNVSKQIVNNKLETFLQFANNQIGKPYDYFQAAFSAFDRVIKINNGEDYKKLFCSEYVAACYKVVGLLPDNINPSELTPEDIFKLPLYQSKQKIKIK